MRLIIYHGVFGGWGWEALDDRLNVVAESGRVFDTRQECEDDGRHHVGRVTIEDEAPGLAAVSPPSFR